MEQEDGDLLRILSVGRATDISETNNSGSLPVDSSPRIWTEVPFFSHLLPSTPTLPSLLQCGPTSFVFPNLMLENPSSFDLQDLSQSIYSSTQPVLHSPTICDNNVNSGFAPCFYEGMPESVPSLYGPPQGEKANRQLLDLEFDGNRTPSAMLTKYCNARNQEKVLTSSIEGIEGTLTMLTMLHPSTVPILSTSRISESGFDGSTRSFPCNSETSQSKVNHAKLKTIGNISSRVKQDSVGENTAITKHKESKNHGPKRRKAQEKRTVCVPAASGIGKATEGECSASDSWTWRKYGQKPIKGSPYPRGYYRCSSSKGCSARKQVERSLTDPSMLVITYTSDHNHPCPAHRNAVGAASIGQNSSERDSSQSSDSTALPCELSSSNSEPSDNPFSSIINCPDQVEDHMISSVPSANMDEVFNLPQDVPSHILRSHTKDEDFFEELGELPNTFALFGRQNLDDRSDDDGGTGTIDPYSLFNWSSCAYDGICLIR